MTIGKIQHSMKKCMLIVTVLTYAAVGHKWFLIVHCPVLVPLDYIRFAQQMHSHRDSHGTIRLYNSSQP